LVKGHIIRYYLMALILRNPFFIFKCINLFGIALYLFAWRLPRLIKKSFALKDFEYLDRGIQRYSSLVVNKLYQLFDSVGLKGEHLSKDVEQSLMTQNFEKNLYSDGLRQLMNHLQEPNTIVILASGTIHEILTPFYTWLCLYFEKQGIQYKGRFLMVGSQRIDAIAMCVGSNKVEMVKQELNKKGLHQFEVHAVYSDNHFFADLPLLLLAQTKGVIIGHSSSRYHLLSNEVKTRFVFSPW